MAGNVKIRYLPPEGNVPAPSSYVKGTNFVAVALDDSVGLPRVTRKFNFNQIASGGGKASHLYPNAQALAIGSPDEFEVDPVPSYTLDVFGDLNVRGDIFTGGQLIEVIVQNLVVYDNIITINSGEQGQGITDNIAGIAIDRGPGMPSGTFMFDETYEKFVLSHGLIANGDMSVNGEGVFFDDVSIYGGLSLDGNLDGTIDFTNVDAQGILSGTAGNLDGYFNELYVSGNDAKWHPITPYLETEPAFVDTNVVSDERLKDNINIIDNPLDKINNLKGVTFTWNDEARNIKKTLGEEDIGVIAQDVEKVIPSAVKGGGEEGYLSVSYYRLVPLLIEAVKNQDRRIAELEEIINKDV